MIAIGANIAIIRDGRIVLTRREDFEVWCLPGGHLEPNETLVQTALREAREETGLEVELTRLVGLYAYPNWRDGMQTILFAARPAGGELRPADGEALDIGYFDPVCLPEPFVWWHRQQVYDAMNGAGEGVAWMIDRVWPFERDMTRAELYALRDESGLSRAGFYAKYMGKPGMQKREL
ncbi:MAG: NUDIX domain-containing protein [Anaerolineae bacterium]|nr:NUDIX domain-containing protein [Anaerolineae bacterium]